MYFFRQQIVFNIRNLSWMQHQWFFAGVCFCIGVIFGEVHMNSKIIFICHSLSEHHINFLRKLPRGTPTFIKYLSDSSPPTTTKGIILSVSLLGVPKRFPLSLAYWFFKVYHVTRYKMIPLYPVQWNQCQFFCLCVNSIYRGVLRDLVLIVDEIYCF